MTTKFLPLFSSLHTPGYWIRHLSVGFMLTLAIHPVFADSKVLTPLIAIYRQECSACHTPYSPDLLPKASWKRIINGLDKHYGSDASLDAASLKQIDAWLQEHSGQGKRARQEPPEDRITRSAWFEQKHRKISADTFNRTSIKSRTNCIACHSGASNNDFDDHNARIPQ